MSKPKVAWIRSADLDFWSDSADTGSVTLNKCTSFGIYDYNSVNLGILSGIGNRICSPGPCGQAMRRGAGAGHQ